MRACRAAAWTSAGPPSGYHSCGHVSAELLPEETGDGIRMAEPGRDGEGRDGAAATHPSRSGPGLVHRHSAGSVKKRTRGRRVSPAARSPGGCRRRCPAPAHTSLRARYRGGSTPPRTAPGPAAAPPAPPGASLNGGRRLVEATGPCAPGSGCAQWGCLSPVDLRPGWSFRLSGSGSASVCPAVRLTDSSLRPLSLPCPRLKWTCRGHLSYYLLRLGHREQVAQDHVRMAFEYLPPSPTGSLCRCAAIFTVTKCFLMFSGACCSWSCLWVSLERAWPSLLPQRPSESFSPGFPPRKCAPPP